jgi:hypothetical protein
MNTWHGFQSSRLLHRWRVRCRRLPTTRPTPRDHQEPICPRKKRAIWTRWRPAPVKNVNYQRPPKNRTSGLVGPHTTPAIVNYKYMTSTPRDGYCWLPTLGTRTSASGARASRSIMEQMVASWSMVMVHGLMAAGPALRLKLARSWGLGLEDPRGVNGTFRPM